MDYELLLSRIIALDNSHKAFFLSFMMGYFRHRLNDEDLKIILREVEFWENISKRIPPNN